MLNLDTHILLFAVTGKLTAREERIVASDQWGISSIVLWEIAKLSQLGRIELHLDHPRIERMLERVTTWPIDREVCRAMTRLDFRADPADELIAATSLAHGVPLLTRDERILQSRITPLSQ